MLRFRQGNNDSGLGSARSDSGAYCLRWDIPVSSARGGSETARTDQRQTAVIPITHYTPINLTGNATAMPPTVKGKMIIRLRGQLLNGGHVLDQQGRGMNLGNVLFTKLG